MAKKNGKIKNKKEAAREGREILEKELEEFIVQQMETYVRLHKEHEKDLKYIG